MPRRPSYDRDELIGRARDLFWRRGWAGTSLKDLERELQMKPGSFYAAFGSKEALFRLALATYARDGAGRLAALVDRHGPLGALQTFPKRVIDGAASPARACMLSKTVLELRAQDHSLAKDAERHLSAMEVQFEALFRQAQAAGQISAARDPAALARRYQSDLLGLRVTAERDSVDAQAIANEIAEGLARL